MARDRAYARLVRAGWPPAALDADPRPSRLQALLDAVEVDDARRRLEDWEDTRATNGVEAPREELVNGRPRVEKGPKVEVRLTGHDARHAELHARAYPEEARARAEQEAERAKQTPFRASRPGVKRIDVKALRA